MKISDFAEVKCLLDQREFYQRRLGEMWDIAAGGKVSIFGQPADVTIACPADRRLISALIDYYRYKIALIDVGLAQLGVTEF